MEAEKIKRNKFIIDKTNEIKESTIKGLEPELHRLIMKNKEELIKKDNEYAERLKIEKENIYKTFDERLKDEKEIYMKEMEDEIYKERQLLSNKLKDNWESYQLNLKDNNDRWRNTLEMERDKNMK